MFLIANLESTVLPKRNFDKSEEESVKEVGATARRAGGPGRAWWATGKFSS